MKRLIKATIVLWVLIPFAVSAQQSGYAKWDDQSLTLDNGKVKRVISIENGIIGTSELSVPYYEENMVSGVSNEFSFNIGDKTYGGSDEGWKVAGIEAVTEGKGHGATLTLAYKAAQFEVKLQYLLYPDLPIIRKRLGIVGKGSDAIELSSINVEELTLVLHYVNSLVLNNYARNRHIAQHFEGDWYDPAIVVHEVDTRRGIAIGNEAPGVTKKITAHLNANGEVTAGLGHKRDLFPVSITISSGETWFSPWVFISPYADTDKPFDVINGPVNDFVRLHMGIRLAEIDQKPVFVYNTWEPFRHDINEKLIMELADAAAECGIEEFVIDDGWQTNYGDWGIDKEKFPNGLKPVFDYIKSKGMKPGIWISLAAAQTTSEVYQKHPEWVVRKENGDPINLHSDGDKMYKWSTYSMCMSSGWYDHIKSIILNLVHEHGLEYIKGDFAVVSGAYTLDKSRSGCYAEGHVHHDTREESMLVNYQRTWQLFDDLHDEAPNLFIDCTFETMGAMQLIDYAMCKHAEGNWLSNFNEHAPTGSLRVRQMAWWRSPVIPATALVIGNQHMHDPNIMLSLKSLAGSVPILLGDPRALSDEKKQEFKGWGEWLRQMQEDHNIMLFRQELQGFGEPLEGHWDGYQRINNDTRSGGIVGVFRQGAMETERTVVVTGLDPNVKYVVKEAVTGKKIAEMNGNNMQTRGFKVSLKELYDAQLFEISMR